jgi:alanyl-tRNA synthetase
VSSNIPTTAADIRQAFTDFFTERGHRAVRSHAVIPPNDPTLYFINAGMVQFKDIFVGAAQVDYPTATSCQKCLRVSGKHNDLENVGRTARHHTLFEMLGNFSFGDYFKDRAIELAWRFLTEVAGLPTEKLHVSVHPDDDEAYDIWHDKIGVPSERIHRDPENFWSMGDTGPCGPCSEIHIDQGPEMSGGVEVPYGDPAGDHRYLEIWNLVFMQYDRSADGTMTPLPKPSIDTGMGLERLVALLQGKTNNFETDLFQPIIGRVAERAGIVYGDEEEQDVALRVIADHSRAAAFLIGDGVYPDNEGRGYVLRRIMRRAIRFGRMIGIDKPFLVDTTAHVIEMMGDVYPELVAGANTIHRIVLREEERFGKTISQGCKRLDEAMSTLQDGDLLDGRVAFELYDTHGFPPDLTALIAGERNVRIDQPSFDEAMNEQRERARAASRFGDGDLSAYQALVEGGLSTKFIGYDELVSRQSVGAILVDGAPVDFAAPGSRVEFVTTETPFYAESGGQVGDRGIATGEGVSVRISDTRRPFGDLVVHIGEIIEGRIDLEVDEAAREATRRNHSATHLLHDALRSVLGEHVRQRGSMVAPDRLRFDFSHLSRMTPEEVIQVEDEVNHHVLRNHAITTEIMGYEEAIEAGAIAFFEEKYTDEVRMLRVGEDSVELCGGTHSRATGDIGLFKIVGESAISSGVRRLEAVTGLGAARWVQHRDALLRLAAEKLHTGPDGVVDRVEHLLEERKGLNLALEKAQTELQVARASSALDGAREVSGKRVAAVRLEGVSGKSLRGIGENLRDRLGSGAVFVAAVDGDKVSLLVAVTSDATEFLHAGKLVGELAPMVGGRGGGRPDMAQAGGGDVAGIDRAIEAFYLKATESLASA